MAALSAFTPYVMPDVPSCPEPMIDDAVRRAAIEFCERTDIIREKLSFNTVASQDNVVLAPSNSGDVARVYTLMYGEEELAKTRRTDFDEDGDKGQPLEYYIELPNTLRLYPVPDVIYALVAYVSVKPDRDATTVDDVLFNNWRDVIASGAKARLMMMSKQPWYDANGAAVEEAIFEAAIDKVSHRRATGGVNAPLRSRAHFF